MQRKSYLKCPMVNKVSMAIINHKGHKLAPHWIEAKSVSGTPLVGGDVKKIHPLTDSSGDTNSSSNTSEESAGASGDGSASMHLRANTFSIWCKYVSNC